MYMVVEYEHLFAVDGNLQAQMYFLLGSMSMREGDNKRAIGLFKRAQEAIPFREGPAQVVISLVG